MDIESVGPRLFRHNVSGLLRVATAVLDKSGVLLLVLFDFVNDHLHVVGPTDAHGLAARHTVERERKLLRPFVEGKDKFKLARPRSIEHPFVKQQLLLLWYSFLTGFTQRLRASGFDSQKSAGGAR